MRSSDCGWVLGVGALFTACRAESEPPPPEPVEIECRLGLVTPDGWSALEDGDTAELVLGFQGFVFVPVVLSAPDAPGRMSTKSSFTEDDGETIVGEQPLVLFDGDGEDRLSEEVLFFLTSGTIASWDGTPGRFATRAEGDGAWCVAAVEVTLEDLVADDLS